MTDDPYFNGAPTQSHLMCHLFHESLDRALHNITRQLVSLKSVTSLVERYKHTVTGDEVYCLRFFTHQTCRNWDANLVQLRADVLPTDTLSHLAIELYCD